MNTFIVDLIWANISASLVFAVILLIKRALGSRMSARFQYAIWFLLIIRLLIPVNIKIGYSFFNILPLSHEAFNKTVEHIESKDHISNGTRASAYDNGIFTDLNKTKLSYPIKETRLDVKELGNNERNFDSKPREKIIKINVKTILLRIWVLGVLVALSRVIRGYGGIYSIRKKSEGLWDSRAYNILSQCKERLGIKKDIPLVFQDIIKTPALTAWFRPLILLPTRLIKDRTDKELEFIFLHELSHYKRRDHLVRFLLTILKVVYWFNPIVHIANSLIIDDMETACDAEVIEKIGVESRRAYAQTLISLFNTNNPFAFSGLAMGAGKGRIAAEKRIRGLFKPNKTRMSVKTISLLLVGIIGIVCFTTACQPTPEGPVVIGKSDGKLEKIIQSKADSEGSNANQNRQVDFSEYSESFQGADERVTININAEVTLPTGNMPVVEVKPRYIDMDQVKAMAEVLFQGSIAYEPKVGFSKADLEEEIIKHKQFISNEQAILEYYGGDQAIAEMVKAEFEKRIEEFENIYQDAPNTIEVKETDWTFRPRAYYENMAILGNEFNEDDEESRELQKYYYDSDMIILDSKVLDYNARITVFNQDTTKNIYHYAHFSMGSSFIGNEGSIPTWDSLDSRPAKLTLEETIDMVQDTLAQMGITNMVLSDCYTLGKPLPGMMISDFSSASSDILKEDGINEVVDIEGNLDKNFIDKNEDEVYGYRMTFVPSYEGIAAHDVAPFSSLDSSASDQYAHTYPYEQLRVTVQNDVITSLYWDSPMEQVQVENSNVPVITLEEAIEIFKKQVKMEYTISKLLGSSDDIDSGEINITDICLGLMRIRIKDRPGAYRMVPAWTFLGYENLNYKDNDGNSQVTAPDSLYPYVVINAIDGSIIDISKGY